MVGRLDAVLLILQESIEDIDSTQNLLMLFGLCCLLVVPNNLKLLQVPQSFLIQMLYLGYIFSTIFRGQKYGNFIFDIKTIKI